MYKKIIIIIITIFFLTACKVEISKIDDLTLEEAVSMAISQNENLYNINNIGYRYYLPRGFTLSENRDNIQILKRNNTDYNLNVDLVSYYNKTDIVKSTDSDLYGFVELKNKSKSGFLEIVKNNDYFFMKMVYNYAIIEAQSKKADLKKTAMNMAYILSSVKYNDTVINNKFGEDVLEFNETAYKIFGPIRVTEAKSHSYYLELYDKYTGAVENKFEDSDVIN